ncbi:hypothetical protein [Cellulomonas endophytica]|uniref:hypothetical protein n=1 Tax=Cellulomonas endophytica TaxID=2494735 RepID=UPI001010AE1C|nr:hypothetical protein [Cellulomonas endophytica]
MTPDDDAAARLRATAARVVPPEIRVDAAEVVRSARRRRAAVRGGGSAALALAMGATFALAGSWSSAAPDLGPAGTEVAPSTSGTPVPASSDAPAPDATAAAEPSDDPRASAPYWYVVSQSRQPDGTLVRRELWYGRDAPGVGVEGGDRERAFAFGPASWGSLVLDGERTPVRWDVLDRLPTGPAALEAVLRASIEPGVGAGTDDDRVVSMARALLVGSPASDDLRRALLAVVAGLPGSVVTPGVEDSLGRPGTLVVHESVDGGEGFRFVVDPADGRLLVEQGTSGSEQLFLEEGPAEAPPVEPTLEMAGCVAWETC